MIARALQALLRVVAFPFVARQRRETARARADELAAALLAAHASDCETSYWRGVQAGVQQAAEAFERIQGQDRPRMTFVVSGPGGDPHGLIGLGRERASGGQGLAVCACGWGERAASTRDALDAYNRHVLAVVLAPGRSEPC